MLTTEVQPCECDSGLVPCPNIEVEDNLGGHPPVVGNHLICAESCINGLIVCPKCDHRTLPLEALERLLARVSVACGEDWLPESLKMIQGVHPEKCYCQGSGKRWLMRRECKYCQGKGSNIHNIAFPHREPCERCNGLGYVFQRPANGYGEATDALGWQMTTTSWLQGDAGIIKPNFTGKEGSIANVVYTEGLKGDRMKQVLIIRAYSAQEATK